MALDQTVASALMRLKVLERALHEPNARWMLMAHADSMPPFCVQMKRIIEPNRVVFSGELLSWFGITSLMTELLCDGEPVLARSITVPDDGDPFTVDWALELRDPVTA